MWYIRHTTASRLQWLHHGTATTRMGFSRKCKYSTKRLEKYSRSIFNAREITWNSSRPSLLPSSSSSNLSRLKVPICYLIIQPGAKSISRRTNQRMHEARDRRRTENPQRWNRNPKINLISFFFIKLYRVSTAGGYIQRHKILTIDFYLNLKRCYSSSFHLRVPYVCGVRCECLPLTAAVQHAFAVREVKRKKKEKWMAKKRLERNRSDLFSCRKFNNDRKRFGLMMDQHGERVLPHRCLRCLRRERILF